MALISITVCFCLPLLTALSVSAGHVIGRVGFTLTIPCTYSVSEGTTTMCWGRGHCPYSKCNSVISWTDGGRVTWRKSDRYQLMGDIAQGNVSLTITGVTMDDAGVYCCRVEITGLFNDLKKEINVEIQEESPRFNPATSTLVNVSSTSKRGENDYTILYAITAVLLVFIPLAGILLYRSRYHERKLNDLLNIVSTISLETLEGARHRALENDYVK